MPFNIQSTASPLTSQYAGQAGQFADMAIRQRLAERERVLAAIRQFAAGQAAKRTQRQAERGGDWAGGAMSGAASGAMAGAPFGPLGMGIGAAAGGIGGGISARNAPPGGGGRGFESMLTTLRPVFGASAAALQEAPGERGAAFTESLRRYMGGLTNNPLYLSGSGGGASYPSPSLALGMP